MTYIIHKKETCETCDELGKVEYNTPNGTGSVLCPHCKGKGHILTEVDLLDVLAKMQIKRYTDDSRKVYEWVSFARDVSIEE